MRNRDTLIANLEAVISKLATVFTRHKPAKPEDPELTLYSGSFASDGDRKLMERVQHQLAQGTPVADDIVFEDARLNELLLRVRARNRADTLNSTEVQYWKSLCNHRVHPGHEGFRSIIEFENILSNMQVKYSDQKTVDMVAALREYGQGIASYSQNFDDYSKNTT